MSVNPSAQKFDILSNDHGRTKVRFFYFTAGIPFLAKFVPKNQNWQFKLKFGTWTNSNMQNSMLMFSFSVLDQKDPFWANLFQKVKVVSLRWNLMPWLIWTCRIQWWGSFSLFLIGNTLFQKFDPKNQTCQFKLKFGT